MTIHLSRSQEQFVRTLLQEGDYASETEVVEEALRLLEEHRLQKTGRKKLENLLLEGLDSGPSTPMTAQDWDEIEREGKLLIAARKNRDAR